MADLIETRCVSPGFCGSEQLLRVACIGDSMMYGQGVPPRDTLPAQLARLLNAGFPEDLVWVDNFGESAGQIWHAWTQFRCRSLAMRFDAVVFSICQNDIMMLDCVGLEYDNPDYVKLWTEDGHLLHGAIDLFSDMKSYCRAAKIVPLVIFYTLLENDRPIIDRIAQICAELQLPFVDLLSFFQARTVANPENYRATEVDGHPSAFGHELAARGIVEILRRSPELPKGRFAAAPERVLAAAMDDLLAQGVAGDMAFAWAADALAAKRRAAQRRLPQQRLADADFAALAVKIRTAAETWRILRRLDVRIALADNPQSRALRRLDQLFVRLRNLEELTFILSRTPQPERLAAIGREFANGWYMQEGRLDFFEGDAPREIAAAREALRGLPAVHLLQRLAEDVAPGLWLSPSAHGGMTLASFAPEFAVLGQFAARLRRQLDLLSSTWTARAQDAQDGDISRLWAIAFQTIRGALHHLRDCEALFQKGPALDAPVSGPWTSIDVLVESEPDAAVEGSLYSMRVEACYRVPRRMPLREAHWGDAAISRYVHRFEIPALLLGDIRVGIADDEPLRERFLRGTTRIAAIAITPGAPGAATAPSPAIEWRGDGRRLPYVDFAGTVLP